MSSGPSHSAHHGARWWYLLLLVPFAALLWVPLYNRVDPMLFGVPFFYWYQFMWVILTSLIILLVDSGTRRSNASHRAANARPE
jgi:Protein of unknown function (DUF3311)